MKAYESNYGTLFHADNHAILKTMPDNSIEALVTDPPYGLSFMGKKWDYDVPSVELWQEVLRVLKPGGHALIACGTRTQHRMVCNIEDAGFEVRDVISWVYGSGFPKSLNIGKAIDKIQGNERVHLGVINKLQSYGLESNNCYGGDIDRKGKMEITRGTSPYEGWGTALKPAVEFFTLVRKPIIEKNIAENVLKWGTGGINMDGCRVGEREKEQFTGLKNGTINAYGNYFYEKSDKPLPLGRFPANFIHDGSDEVVRLFPESKSIQSIRDNGEGERKSKIVYGNINKLETLRGHDDQGSAARFFYCAKASPSERNEGLEEFEAKEVERDFGTGDIALKRSERQFAKMQNFHPTVKPLALMQYLIRLITPPDGVVLDCFAGSGTTGVAAVKERKKYVLIEREEEYIKIIEARVKHAESKIDPTLFDEVV